MTPNQNQCRSLTVLVLTFFIHSQLFATWSIIAVDRETGEIGIAGASCTFDVSGIASVVPGKGAIVVQAGSDYFARMKGVELMNQGSSLEDILRAMKDERFNPERQQYGVILLNTDTRPLVYSGTEIQDWNGEKVGNDFAVMGNILPGEQVVLNAYKTFNENRDKPLAERLMLALKAGEEAGGDKRCGTQSARSAFIMVYNPKDDAIFKMAIQGIEKGGKPAVTLLNQQFAWHKEEEKNISIVGDKHIVGIQNSLVPVHYLEGRENAKTIPQMMEEDHIPGVSIAFFDNGKITWQKTYGYSNLEDSVKVTPNTVFNGASLSKPVTAMAALKLVEQGVLTLNEDINNYLEDWKVPDNKFTEQEKVTLKRLIGHTAGFERYVQSSYFPNEELPTIDQMLAGEKPSVDPAVSVVSVPGQKQIYSNPGYSVIEKLMEDVTKQEFNAVLTELIFEPCDMTHSSFEQPVPKHLSEQMATGYSNKLEPYPYKLFPYKAAGGIWTTPTDLAKFLLTVLEDHHSGANVILSKRMTDSIFTKTPTRLGFAKIYNDESEDILFEHWGSNSGFTCYMVTSLNNKQGVVIMTNSDNGMSLMSYITRAVAVAYNWDFLQPKGFDRIAMDGLEMNTFTGKFKGGNEVLEFEVVEGTLHLLSGTATPSKLVPVAESKFISPDDDTLYEFLKNKEGEMKYVRMTKANGYNSDYLKQETK